MSPIVDSTRARKAVRLMPADTGSISLLLAHSVFTHTMQSHAEYYLREAARVLKPGRRNLRDLLPVRETVFSDDAGLPERPYVNTRDPTNAVMFDREWLDASLSRLGLGVVRVQPPVVRGFQWGLHIRPISAGEPVVPLPEDHVPFGRLPPPQLFKDVSRIGR